MAAAYVQHRFGRAEYDPRIDGYRADVERLDCFNKDRDVLHAGDEILCKHCLLWHRTYQPDPDDPRDYMARMLYFDCPHAAGAFYGGRVGEPPHDPERGRRHGPRTVDHR